MHRHLASAVQATMARLRPHLALIDRLRLLTQGPVAPRVRATASPQEEERAFGSERQGVPAGMELVRANSVSARALLRAGPIIETVTTRNVFADHTNGATRQSKTRFAGARESSLDMLLPAASRRLPASAAQARRMVARSASFTPHVVTDAVRPTRLLNVTHRATPQSVALRASHPNPPSASPRDDTLFRAISKLAGRPVKQQVLQTNPMHRTHGLASATVAQKSVARLSTVHRARWHETRMMDGPSTWWPAKFVQSDSPFRLAYQAGISLAETAGSSTPRQTTSPTQSVGVVQGLIAAAKWRVSASSAPAAPQTLAPPMDSSPVAPPPLSASARGGVPALPTSLPLADGSLDATRVVRWLTRALGTEAARPPAAGSGFDPRRTPAWIPSFYSKGT